MWRKVMVYGEELHLEITHHFVSFHLFVMKISESIKYMNPNTSYKILY